MVCKISELDVSKMIGDHVYIKINPKHLLLSTHKYIPPGVTNVREQRAMGN